MSWRSVPGISERDVGPGPDRFFGPVVEIVPKGRSNLALQLNGGNQPSLVEQQDVPKLGRAELAGPGKEGALLLDLSVRQATDLYKVYDKGEKPVHILAGGEARRDGSQNRRLTVTP